MKKRDKDTSVLVQDQHFPKAERPMTLRKLAAMLHVAPMTVSNVMNNMPGPSDETRKRVFELAKEYDYVPSVAGRVISAHRSLHSKQAHVRAIVLLLPATPPLDSRLSKLIHAIQEEGHLAIVMLTANPEKSLADASTHVPLVIINLRSQLLVANWGRKVVNGHGKSAGEIIAEYRMVL